MTAVTMNLEDDLVTLLNEISQPVDRTAREIIIIELYRRVVVSGGKAAELLGLSRSEFIQHASKLGIPFFNMSEAEWDEERKQSEAL